MNVTRKIKIAIAVSHPIQHFCPQYASLAESGDIQLKVFFASRLGETKYLDKNFGTELSWGNLQLDRFEHEFVNGEAVLQADQYLDAPLISNRLEDFAPDLVFTYGYFQKFQRRVRQWAISKGVPTAYISDSEMRHRQTLMDKTIKRAWLYFYFKKPTFFLTMGDANEAYYKCHGVGVDKMVRMHYPIDRDFYQQQYLQREYLRQKLREEFGIGSEEIVLVVVGKLVEWKDQIHIVQAMQFLEQKEVRLKLFVVGSGKNEDTIREATKQLQVSEVIFPGFVPIEKLPGYYAASDIYIHPARMEPHSVAISEAIFMGLPIILSDTCGSYGPTDDVVEGENGLVYKYGDIAQLAEKILWLINTPAKRNAFGVQSHQRGIAFQERSHGGFLIDLLAKFKTE